MQEDFESGQKLKKGEYSKLKYPLMFKVNYRKHKMKNLIKSIIYSTKKIKKIQLQIKDSK